MKPFFVLLISFLIAALTLRLLHDRFEWQLAGRISLSIVLLFTSLGHFLFTKGMTAMIPPFIPAKKAIVILTGLLEIVAAITLLIPELMHMTGWFLVVFFVLLLPANIYAAAHSINYEKPEEQGPGLSYLWFRVPFQALLIALTIYSVILA